MELGIKSLSVEVLTSQELNIFAYKAFASGILTYDASNAQVFRRSDFVPK